MCSGAWYTKAGTGFPGTDPSEDMQCRYQCAVRSQVLLRPAQIVDALSHEEEAELEAHPRPL